MGGDSQEPAAMAFPVRRSRYGAARRWAWAHLPRPVLERVLRHPKPVRRGGPAALRELYARPGAMHAGFAQFAALDQDAADNKAFLAAGKLDMPVLALGGEHDALCRERRGR